MTDEMYVRSVWKGASYFGFSGGVGGYITTDDLALSDSQISSIAAWADAAGFTRQRLKEIQQVEDEIRICEGCLRFWQEPLGTEYGGVVPMRRILAREKAALAELKRGMKEEMR